LADYLADELVCACAWRGRWVTVTGVRA